MIESDSSHDTAEQAQTRNSLAACESDSFRYSLNMAEQGQKAGSGTQRATTPEQVDVEREKRAGRKSITDGQMRCFQAFLTEWIAKHCTNPDGTQWSQRTIGTALGVSQNELSAWLNDRARPGLPRLIRIRSATGVCLETMLGLEPTSTKRAS